jgi:hypothetical protein
MVVYGKRMEGFEDDENRKFSLIVDGEVQR